MYEDTCPQCGCALKGRQKYCSLSCSGKSRLGETQCHIKSANTSDEEMIKRRAKHKVKIAIAGGVLHPSDCVLCGEPYEVAHHQDYSKPLVVDWLCKKCHLRVHAVVGELCGAPYFPA